MSDQDKIIKVKSIKKVMLKNGEFKEYIYDQSIYSKKYYSKNKEGYNKKMVCDCGHTIFISNMKNHLSGKKHKKTNETNDDHN